MGLFHQLSRRSNEPATVLLSLPLTVLPRAYGAPFNSSTADNTTISVPEGTSNHGDPTLLCAPSSWRDIAIFFLANFVAHAATVKLLPGEPVLEVSFAMISALLFPTSGVVRGLDAIVRHAVSGSTPLQKAQKAGALCEVVRAPDWEPQPGDFVREQGLELPDWCRGPEAREKDMPMLEKVNRVINAWAPKTTPGFDKAGILIRTISPSLQILYSIRTVLRFKKAINDNGASTELCSQSLESRPLEPDQSASVTALQVPSEPPNVWIKRRKLTFKPSNGGIISRRSWRIHGVCRLPSGYELATVHPDCIVEEMMESENNGQTEGPSQTPISAEISSSYNVAKGAAAILQLLYASATLYLTRGDQLKRYGYAAFGLTVAPYLVMSLVNLLSVLLTPDHPTCFMVESEIMKEAERRGGASFQGMVGKMKTPEGPIKIMFHVDAQGCNYLEIKDLSLAQGLGSCVAFNKMSTFPVPLGAFDDIQLPACPSTYEESTFPAVAFSVIVALLPLAINGGLSHFKEGNSTHTQRVWTMTWLAVGGFVGLFVPFVDETLSSLRIGAVFETALGLCLYSAPAIGGFIVVGQMLLEYGNCVQI